MRCCRSAAVVVAAAMLGAGCGQTAPLPAPVAAVSAASGRPQSKLPTIRLWLGPAEIVAEQAVNMSQIQTGMMFRTEMGENEGMLFIFPRPHQASFWMRNTLLPLSCAYIDGAGKVLEVHDMKPRDETPIEASTDQVQYVLEMRQGWFERNKIGPGVVMRTERGTLAETYFRGQ